MRRSHQRRQAGPAKLSARRRWSVYAVGLGVWASGCGWLIFHYGLRRQGPFGPEADPLEPWWLKLHGGLAFASLWLLGLLWGVHVLNGWRSHRRRWSGAGLLALMFALIASGYLLYYAGDEGLRAAVSLGHWIIGLAAPAVFALHRWRTARAARVELRQIQASHDENRGGHHRH